MKFKHTLVLAAGLAIMGVGAHAVAAKPTASPIIEHAKKLIAARLIDPSSLQVRNTRVVKQDVQGKPLTVGCGEYNSKNRMGGYTGFQTFAYEPTVLHGVVGFDGEHFDFFAEDGGSEAEHPSFFDDSTAHILAVCLGLKE